MSKEKSTNSVLLVPIVMVTLLITLPACQPAAEVTSQWLPAYLQLSVTGGEAQMKANSSDWQTIAERDKITVKEESIITSSEEAIYMEFGDGSTLELAPDSSISLLNMNAIPQLKLELVTGNVMMLAQQPSYEFSAKGCTAQIASTPTRVRIKILEDGINLAVDQGSLLGEFEDERFVISTCRELQLREGQEKTITSFCATTAAPPSSPSVPSVTNTATSTRAATATQTPTPTETATPARSATPSLSPTSTMTPTNTASPTPTPSSTRIPLPPQPTSTPSPLPTLAPTETPTNAPPPPPPPPPTNTPKPRSAVPLVVAWADSQSISMIILAGGM